MKRFVFEAGFVGCDHAAYGVGFQMLPHEFIGIGVRRVGRQIEQPQPFAERFNEGFHRLHRQHSPLAARFQTKPAAHQINAQGVI